MTVNDAHPNSGADLTRKDTERLPQHPARVPSAKETTFAEDITDSTVLKDTLRWAAQEIPVADRQATVGKGLLYDDAEP